MKLLINILLLIFVSCTHNSNKTFNIYFEQEIYTYTANFDSLNNECYNKILKVYADTFFVVKTGDELIFPYVVNHGKSVCSGILGDLIYFVKGKNKDCKIIGSFSDEYSYRIQIASFDFDNDYLPEIISFWSDESVFHLKVDKIIDGKIEEVYKTERLGNPEIWDYQHYEKTKNDLIIHYQTDDALHKKFKLVYDDKRKEFKREPLTF